MRDRFERRWRDFVTSLGGPDEDSQPRWGWSTAPDTGHSDWTSGPALLAVRILNEGTPEQPAKDVIEHGFTYMFDSRTEFYGWLARLLLFMAKGAEGVQLRARLALVAGLLSLD